MREKKNTSLLISSGVIAFCLQALLVIGLFLAFFTKPKKYTTIANSSIAIQSIDIKAYLELESKSIQKDMPKNNPLEGGGLQEMFARTDIQTTNQAQTIDDDRATRAQNTKALNELADKSRALTNALQNIKTLSISNISSNKQDGEFDAWYAQVSLILQKEWDNSLYFLPSDLLGVAAITINQRGQMHFIIKRYAQESQFDAALESTLKNLELASFPPPPNGSRTILVEFKSNPSR